MDKNLNAKVTIKIDAPLNKVWDAFVNPEVIKKYMMGATVFSTWEVGTDITWKGEWQGTPFEDRGKVLRLVPEKTLQFTHFSPLGGLPDVPENYHTVTIELVDEKTDIHVSLLQENNHSEKEKEESEKNWGMMLSTLKKILEE